MEIPGCAAETPLGVEPQLLALLEFLNAGLSVTGLLAVLEEALRDAASDALPASCTAAADAAPASDLVAGEAAPI